MREVDQITFSGPQALRQGQEAIYVTERAVFRLTQQGVVLDEVAPGVDLQRDVLERMGFSPLMPKPPAPMSAVHFDEVDRVASRARAVSAAEPAAPGNDGRRRKRPA